MTIQQLIYIPVLTALFGITVFILTRNIRSRINVFFGLFTATLFVWLTGLFFADSAVSEPSALFWTRFAVFFACLIPVFFLWFSFVFPLDSKPKLRTLLVYLLPGIALMGTAPTDLMIKKVKIGEYVSEPTELGVAYTIFLIYFVLYFLAAFIILFKRYRVSGYLARSQIKFVLVGTVFGVAVNVVFNFVFVILNVTGIGLLLGGPSILVFTALVAYAVVRHRLFDIKLVLARTVAYLILLSILTGVYGLMILLSSIFLFEDQQILFSRQIFYALSAVFAALIIQPFKRSIDKLSNSIFYRDAYDPQVFLDELNKELVTNIDLVSLLSKCANIISNNIKASFVVFGLKETAYSPQRIIGDVIEFSPEDVNEVRSITPKTHQTVIVTDELEEGSNLKTRLRKYDIAVLARLSTDVDLEIEGLGYLMLGVKKSGNPYNKQDIKMIEIIANELVIAAQNALRFEEIEKFNVTLQEKVDSATAELKRTNEKLQELDETKDEFISMASHQLRTPLTSVKGYLSMVLEGDVGKVNKQQNKMLEQAFLSSQRMVYLIADLLNVSRLKTGKFVIDAKETNLADVAETEIEQLRPTARSRDLTLEFHKPKDFPTLIMDETKIRQVLMNFIDNAIYYTPAGGKITVTLEDKGEVIEYKVTDTGIGVPRSERHNLFSKFYRAGNARKARPDGTGLGLFMAKKVVVAQGGAVIFESEEGKGSTFGFTFSKEKLAKLATESKESTTS